MGDDLDRIIEAMQNTINEDTRAVWGEEAYQRWVNPPNMGPMPDADGTAELRGTCGDSMAIYLRFDGDRVGAASLKRTAAAQAWSAARWRRRWPWARRPKNFSTSPAKWSWPGPGRSRRTIITARFWPSPRCTRR